MIPNNTKQGTVKDELGQVKKTALAVDPKAMAHIMHLLTNLYSDEELACIREYSTNAWDSHIVANQTRPIEVSLPSRLSPTLRIKDYGTGMNIDDIQTTFAWYGASTKREDERQNGAMGIGGKAALAYGNSFTVVGVKGGIKTTLMVSRDEDGAASASILDESKTDDPNGVEIQIPTRTYNGFEHKAKEFFKFWQPGTVLVNGVEPDRSDMKKMTERIYTHDGDNDVVVMGNVAYPLDYGKTISMGDKVAVFVTMNSSDEIVFTPAREGLIYNGITNASLKGIREEYNASLFDYIKTEVEAQESFIDAYKMYSDFKNKYRNLDLRAIQYNSLSLVSQFLKYDDGTVMQALTWVPGRTRSAVSTQRVSVDTIANSSGLIISGYKGVGVSSDHKRRIKQYAREIAEKPLEKGYYSPLVILFSGDSMPDTERTEGFQTTSWKDILDATKPEKVARAISGFSYDGAYNVWVEGYGWDVLDLEDGDDVLYYSTHKQYMSADIRDRIIKENPDIKIVQANANRHKKLVRLHPTAVRFESYKWEQKFTDEDFAKLTADDLENLKTKFIYEEGYNRWSYRSSFLQAIKDKYVSEIADPELRNLATLYKAPEPVVGLSRNSKSYDALTTEWQKIRDNVKSWKKTYPLSNWKEYPEETLAYINNVYESKEN